jgi:hypothetical protein
MHDTRTGQFNCPNCDALYHLIETEAGPETVDLELTCVACGAPLSFPAREGPVVFKYFLSGSSRRKARNIRPKDDNSLARTKSSELSSLRQSTATFRTDGPPIKRKPGERPPALRPNNGRATRRNVGGDPVHQGSHTPEG